MQADPPCPVCKSMTWKAYGSRTYRADAIAGASGSSKTNLRVLFEVWLPEGEDSFTARFVGCSVCGFFCYHPRPTDSNLQAKYEFGASLGDDTRSAGEHPKREAQRAKRVWDIVSPYLTSMHGSRRILDYGGGSGKLMTHFLSVGHACFLVDFCSEVFPGVEKIGNTEGDLTSHDSAFDAIVCSHVIEHLADPLDTVRTLANCLALGGIIYIEVPMEVFGRLPAAKEPVTHINFFTPQSLENLMVAAGLAVKRCELTSYPHPSGGLKPCIIGIGGRPDQASQKLTQKGLVELEQLLSPDISMRLRKEALLASDLPRRVAVRVTRKIRAIAGALH